MNYHPFYTGLLEALPFPVVVIDRSLYIYGYNQPFLRLLDITALNQKKTLDQILPDSAIIQFIRDSIQRDSSQSSEFVRGSSEITWKVSLAPLKNQPQQTNVPGEDEQQIDSSERYFAVTIEDRAEIRHLERVQRDFIANVSHELRTPLSSIRLLTETLEDVIDTNPDKAQVFVEKIEIEVQHLNDLVAELLELSRIESGHMQMVIEPVEAEQLVREVMARMLLLAQRHRVALHTDIQQGKTLVAADSKQIVRVLVNLVHNAIKFTPSGGMIIIGTSTQKENYGQRFFVHDTGVGIRPEELSRIFERFYKTNRARSKTDFIGPGGGGTGLGLAIARNVVEAHGGRITAESVVGQGSVFSFILPVAVRKI